MKCRTLGALSHVRADTGGLRQRCEESALALLTLAITLVTSRVPRTWRSRQEGRKVLRIRVIPVCRGTEGDRTFWNNHGGKGKRRISSSWKQDAQAEVSGPSVPICGASLRMTSLCKGKPILCSSVPPLGLICKCKYQPGLIFQAEK